MNMGWCLIDGATLIFDQMPIKDHTFENCICICIWGEFFFPVFFLSLSLSLCYEILFWNQKVDGSLYFVESWFINIDFWAIWRMSGMKYIAYQPMEFDDIFVQTRCNINTRQLSQLSAGVIRLTHPGVNVNCAPLTMVRCSCRDLAATV